MATATYVKHRRQVEEGEQQRFINHIKRQFPHVIVYCDVIGEDLTPSGRRRAAAMRSRKKIPDVIIDYPSRGYHGARFEFKPTGTAIYKKDGKTLRAQPYRYTRGGKLYSGDHLKEQAATLLEMNKAGYYARFVVGYEMAIKHLYWYMDIKENAQFEF